MKTSRIAAVGAVASVALLAGAAAFAQSPSAQGGRMVEVPQGAVVLVLPAGTMAGPSFASAGFPFADMQSPVTMIRQMDHEMDQMMANMQRSFATTDAAMRNLPQANGAMSGVIVTSYSDGHGTCTQRIIYGGNGAPPVVQVSSTGDACASPGMPTTAPEMQAPKSAMPHLIEVQNHTHASAPLLYAEAKQ